MYEILDYMESYARRRNAEKREQVAIMFMLAQIIAERSPLTDKKNNEMSYPWDYYPKLFEKDKEIFEKEKEERELEEYVTKRRRAMKNFNMSRKEV